MNHRATTVARKVGRFLLVAVMLVPFTCFWPLYRFLRGSLLALWCEIRNFVHELGTWAEEFGWHGWPKKPSLREFDEDKDGPLARGPGNLRLRYLMQGMPALATLILVVIAATMIAAVPRRSVAEQYRYEAARAGQ